MKPLKCVFITSTLPFRTAKVLKRQKAQMEQLQGRSTCHLNLSKEVEINKSSAQNISNRDLSGSTEGEYEGFPNPLNRRVNELYGRGSFLGNSLPESAIVGNVDDIKSTHDDGPFYNYPKNLSNSELPRDNLTYHFKNQEFHSIRQISMTSNRNNNSEAPPQGNYSVLLPGCYRNPVYDKTLTDIKRTSSLRTQSTDEGYVSWNNDNIAPYEQCQRGQQDEVFLPVPDYD